MTTQEINIPTALMEPQRPSSAPLLAAIDIGGTKIAAGLVEADGTLVYQVQHPTPAEEGAAAVIRAVYEAVDDLAADPRWSQVRGLGIGSAGPIDIAAGTVSPVNIPCWRKFPLVRAVTAHPAVARLPTVLGGDAVAMAAAEHWCGAARGHDNALCLVVSTGVGAGLILNGAVHPGPSGNAGHLGHISVDLDGAPCACGSRGCLEGLASGTAITRRALENGWRPGGPGVPGGTVASAAAVAASARAGDPIALASFDRAGQALAAGIAAVADLVDIEVAIVGGGVAKAGEVLFAPLERHLKDYLALSFTLGVTAIPAHLGTDAGLIGAAALVAPVALRGATAR